MSHEPSAMVASIAPLHIVAVAEQELSRLQISASAEPLGELLRGPERGLLRARYPGAGDKAGDNSCACRPLDRVAPQQAKSVNGTFRARRFRREEQPEARFSGRLRHPRSEIAAR